MARNPRRPLTERALSEFRSLMFRRAAGTPVQYLIGTTEFFGLELNIGNGVYIPKGETELLVEEVLKFLKTPQRSDMTWGKSPTRAVVHEVGTGSGAIAISIARHAPRADIAASDISAFALSLARANAKLNGVAERVRFRFGGFQDPLPGIPGLVVANLPYIEEKDDSDLPPEVRAQPRSSLLSKSCGLAHIERLLEKLIVKPGGKVMLEIGFSQAGGVRALCADNPNLLYERTVKDLAGHDRIAVIAAA